MRRHENDEEGGRKVSRALLLFILLGFVLETESK